MTASSTLPSTGECGSSEVSISAASSGPGSVACLASMPSSACSVAVSTAMMPPPSTTNSISIEPR
ncbi:hypothetical protein [Aquincola sp. J276]|uniref:hypothetical protein n=1 Tax=Aquincola sp. J276 TaxID=2898432 RepID=UPI002151FD72|nr:hypothetical protein [Aquincola sp. J276]MCR5866191.1 hypothetical protein [Aquincola sp. J276]